MHNLVLKSDLCYCLLLFVAINHAKATSRIEYRIITTTLGRPVLPVRYCLLANMAKRRSRSAVPAVLPLLIGAVASAAGGSLALSPCNASKSSQVFHVDLIARHVLQSGRCWDGAGGGVEDGVELDLYACKPAGQDNN